MEKSKNRNPNTEELEKGFRTAFIDGEYNSNLAYRPEFLSNNAAEGKKVLSAIESELLRCDEFAISVAFITNSGIEPFMQTFKELERRNIPGRILTTNYLNFSDPWPKARHAKRRLTHRNFLAKYQRLLGKGGHLRFKTDNRALFDFSVEEFKEFGLEIIALSYDLHNSDYDNEVQTEYERKFSSLGTPINFCEVVF